MEHSDVGPTPNRRRFLNTLAAGAASFGLSTLPDVNPLYAAVNPSSDQFEDLDAWLNRIKGKHKMVFDATQPHGVFPFAWPRVFLATNQATGAAEKDCCAVVVLRHDAIPYAFDHSLWSKYKLGEVFKAPDPATNNPSTRNPFWNPPAGSFVFPGMGEVPIGINDLMKSGVLFCVCNAAITVYGSAVAAGSNLKAEDVIGDWKKGLIPGIQIVPSGVWALGRAQEKGCGYVFTG